MKLQLQPTPPREQYAEGMSNNSKSAVRNPKFSAGRELDVEQAQTSSSESPGLVEQSVKQLRLRTVRAFEELRRLHQEGAMKADRLRSAAKG